MNLSKKIFAEFLGSAGLLAVVVGSGIMSEKLAGGNAAIALMANAIATGAGLVFLILAFANISGAHFNPSVTLTEFFDSKINLKDGIWYLFAQILGALTGVGLANVMFDLPVYLVSTKSRTGSSQFLSELVATFGLIAMIKCVSKFRPDLIFLAVAAYITSAYWFTSSTSFANPAVTIARSLSDTFAGISPANVPMFIAAQLLGASAAAFVFKWLLEEEENV